MLTFTKAVTTDIPQLCILLDILFSQEAEFKPDTEAQQRGLQSIIDNPQTGYILTARHEGIVVGMVNILFTISTVLGGQVAILEDMIIAPDQRGGGTGSKLIQYGFATARENKCKRITLLTDSNNTTGHAFYTKHGFTFSSMLTMRKML